MSVAIDREAVLNEIIEHELSMFIATRNEGGVSACQQRPDTFRAMRNMTHCAHDDATLLSYLNDLQRAVAAGRNFMIEKYARMDDLLPPLNNSPLLDEIVDAEAAFLEEACALYPHVIKRNGQGFFKNYMRCELETFSVETLALYAASVRRARDEGRNLAVERHRYLARLMGKESLEELA